MSTSAIPAQGTKFQIGSGSPVAFQDIPEINSFNGPGGSASVIDVTDLSSTAKEKMAGLKDNGQLSLDLNYIPQNAVHALLKAAQASGAVTPFKIIFTDGTEWDFDVIVISFPVSGGVDGVVKGSVTLEITGDIIES